MCEIEPFLFYTNNQNAKTGGNDLTVSLPKKVVFPGVCVLGIASEVTMVFHNPKQRWVQLSLNCVKVSYIRFSLLSFSNSRSLFNVCNHPHQLNVNCQK